MSSAVDADSIRQSAGDKYVDFQTAKNLVIAQEAMKYARELVPEPGNQEKYIKSSDGRATQRAMAVQNLQGKDIPDISSDARHYFDTPQATVPKAVCLAGGTCMEISRIVQFYLAGRIQGSSIHRVRMEIEEERTGIQTIGYKHDFIIIGDLHGDKNTWVLVDAWVERPEAILWVDSIWYTTIDSDLEILESMEGSELTKHDSIERKQREFYKHISWLTHKDLNSDFTEKEARSNLIRAFEVKTAKKSEDGIRYLTQGKKGQMIAVFPKDKTDYSNNPVRRAAITSLRKRRAAYRRKAIESQCSNVSNGRNPAPTRTKQRRP